MSLNINVLLIIIKNAKTLSSRHMMKIGGRKIYSIEIIIINLNNLSSNYIFLKKKVSS